MKFKQYLQEDILTSEMRRELPDSVCNYIRGLLPREVLLIIHVASLSRDSSYFRNGLENTYYAIIRETQIDKIYRGGPKPSDLGLNGTLFYLDGNLYKDKITRTYAGDGLLDDKSSREMCLKNMLFGAIILEIFYQKDNYHLRVEPLPQARDEIEQMEYAD